MHVRARPILLLALVGMLPGLLVAALAQVGVDGAVPLTVVAPGLWMAVLGGAVGIAVGLHREAGSSP